jgi:hypothetical protein
MASDWCMSNSNFFKQTGSTFNCYEASNPIAFVELLCAIPLYTEATLGVCGAHILCFL